MALDNERDWLLYHQAEARREHRVMRSLIDDADGELSPSTRDLAIEYQDMLARRRRRVEQYQARAYPDRPRCPECAAPPECWQHVEMVPHVRDVEEIRDGMVIVDGHFDWKGDCAEDARIECGRCFTTIDTGELEWEFV